MAMLVYQVYRDQEDNRVSLVNQVLPERQEIVARQVLAVHQAYTVVRAPWETQVRTSKAIKVQRVLLAYQACQAARVKRESAVEIVYNAKTVFTDERVIEAMPVCLVRKDLVATRDDSDSRACLVRSDDQECLDDMENVVRRVLSALREWLVILVDLSISILTDRKVSEAQTERQVHEVSQVSQVCWARRDIQA